MQVYTTSNKVMNIQDCLYRIDVTRNVTAITIVQSTLIPKLTNVKVGSIRIDNCDRIK